MTSGNSNLLALMAQQEDDPVTRALLSTVQERLERRQEIQRLDGEMTGLKTEVESLRHESHSLRQAKDDLSRQLTAMSMAKETVNVYDLESLLNENWEGQFQEIGTELRKIRIEMKLPEIKKDPTHVIPGTPRNRQPRENHKAVCREFCRRRGYPIPPILR